MKLKKVVFLGSKNIGYKCFQHLIANQKLLNYEIVAVLTNEKTALPTTNSLTTLAKENNIPILQHEDELLKLKTVDILISVQYHRILLQPHIAKAKQIAVNLHMAPLPDYRGCNQFSFAILDDAKTFGTTIHQMETGIDNGAILFEKRFPIPKNCFVKTLYDLTETASIKLFKKHLADLINQNYKPISQASLIKKRGTHFHLRNEINAIKKIDLSWNKEKIARHIRATYFPPFEPPYTIIDDTKYYIQPKP